MRTTCRGGIFPPVVVYDDGTDKWLSEGFHRLYAARQMGMPEIAAEVRQGTKRDAQLNSMRSNATHGARRSNADKRRAVEMAFRYLIEGGRTAQGVTNVEVAEMANVNEKTVRRLREEIMPETDTTSAKPKAPEITISAPPDLTVTARLKDELAAAERRIAELEARQPETVEVERVVVEVPPEAQQELDALRSELQSSRERMAKLDETIAKARKEGNDYESMIKKKFELRDSIDELLKHNELVEMEHKWALVIVKSARDIRDALNRNMGVVEDAARKGVPAWANATPIKECAERCYEMGDLLSKAVQVIDMPTGGSEYERVEFD